MKNTGHYKTYGAADFEPDLLSDWPYRCAMSLLKHPVDEAISEQLAFMGKAANADRAWMIEYRPDLLRFSNTHEWCRGRAKSFVAELQDIPTTMLAWLHRHLAKGHAVAIHDVRGMPRAARIVQVEFLRQGNKSVLSVPVLHDKKLHAIIGFDTTARYKTWSRAEVGALYQCANLIGQARYAHHPRQSAMAAYEHCAPLVYLSMSGVIRGVAPAAIVGVRSAGNYSEIWLQDGSMVLDSRALGLWSALLPDKYFFRVHRTAVVNALHVVDVDRRNMGKWLLHMRSVPAAWPVSRAYRQDLRERMGIWPRQTGGNADSAALETIGRAQRERRRIQAAELHGRHHVRAAQETRTARGVSAQYRTIVKILAPARLQHGREHE